MALCLLGGTSAVGVPKPLTAQDNLVLRRAESCGNFLTCLQKDITGRNTNFYEWVQIGAHNGENAFDPVGKVARESKWKGLLIEPDPTSFANLMQTDLPNDYKYEQAAIGSQSEAMKRNITLYSIRADHGLQYDMSRMSSTSYNHVLGKSSALFQEKGANAQDFIVANTVDVKDINQVLTDNEIGSFTKEHGGPLETFRLLTVDTEEHDAKVLMELNLEERGNVPHFLAYKQNHLTPDEASQLEQKLATKFPHREIDGDAVYVWRDV